MTPLSIAYPSIDPVAVHLGPLSVRWYGLAYVAGFVAAWLVLRWLNKRWDVGLTLDDQLSILLAAVIGVLLGGRIGYVLFYNLAYYVGHPAAILALWDGGMSFHGALVGVIIAGVIVARAVGMPFWTLADMAAVGTPIGLFLGRLANFINGELWGRTTAVAWGMVFPGAGALPRHPSQIYEALLEGVVLLVVLVILARRPRPQGFLFGVLLAGYGVARIFIEFFREPDVQITYLPSWITMGQVLTIPVLLLGVWLIWWSLRPGRPLDGPSAVETPKRAGRASAGGS